MKDGKSVVLCIDDDSDVLDFLGIVLEAAGYVFSCATSGEEGLRLYKTLDPDIVIVDLMMEEVDSGVGFARQLQVLRNEAPVYMLSSVGDSLSVTTDYADLGLAGVFQKPLSKDQLLTVLGAKVPR